MRRAAELPALILTAAIGVWLLAAPYVLDLPESARLSHVVAGPIIASIAVIAMWDVVRLLARANVLFGIWLVVAPIFIAHDGWWWESAVAGLAVTALALIPTSHAERYGGGWLSLIRR